MPGVNAYEPSKTPDRWTLAGIVTFTLALYSATAAHHVLGGDNGEFLVVAEKGGVAHPSGYPLYVLYLRLVSSWWPFPPPHAAALATGVLGAVATGGLYVAARRWGASRFGALLGAVLLGLSPRAWIASTHAEVFALNALFASVLLVITAPAGTATGMKHPTRHVAGLCLVSGFALANHLTITLLAPVGLVALVRGIAASRRRLTTVALGAFGVTVELLPYLTLLLEPGQRVPWSWGYPRTLGALLAHVVRRDYGTFDLGLNNQGGTALEHVFWLASNLVSDLLWWPLVFLPLGLFAILGRGAFRACPGHRSERWALVLTLLTTGPLFVARFNLGQDGVSSAVTQRFYLLPELVVCLILALGVTVAERTAASFVGRNMRKGLGVVFPLLVCVASGLRNWDEVAEHHSPAVERYLENTLESSPSRAVILGTGDHRLFGLAYLQGAAGLRPDVTYVDPIMLHYPWYRSLVSGRLGMPLPAPQGGSVSTAELAKLVLDSGRPLLLANVFTQRIVTSFPSYPQGTLIRILPRGHRPPSPSEVRALNTELLGRFRLDYPEPRDPHSWAWHVHQEYLRPWRVLGRAGS